MRFYRVRKTTDGGNSAGFDYVANRREAERIAAAWRRENKGEWAEVDEITIGSTKAAILWALRAYASHPDNG